MQQGNELAIIGNQDLVNVFKDKPNVRALIKAQEDLISQMSDGAKVEYLESIIPGIAIGIEGISYLFLN